jgi:dGTPase
VKNAKPRNRQDAASRGLAPYAARAESGPGRLHAEPEHAWRREFQRDRDRVIHSSGFRRLVYKTQVFINHEGDLYRTRLTHSLEVAQIARTVARALRLDEDLIEAIALAHDLGHPPFGHAGEAALNECMQPWGGFEHNLQSLRMVDELEDRYLGFAGLNLCFETREGILKHCSRRNARRLGAVGARFLLRQQPGLEAQVVNLADEIAYNNHDVDDGLRSGLLGEEALHAVPLFRRHHVPLLDANPEASRRALIHETIRGMINEVVSDMVATTNANIAVHQPASIGDVRALGHPLVALSPATRAAHLALKRFLHRHLYRHERVLNVTSCAQNMLKALFACYMNSPEAMPVEHSTRALLQEAARGEAGRALAVADYVAGMTDRYAFSEYRRLVDATAEFQQQ